MTQRPQHFVNSIINEINQLITKNKNTYKNLIELNIQIKKLLHWRKKIDGNINYVEKKK